MAKPTPEQLEAYKAKGYKESRIESIPQATFDKMFPKAEKKPAPKAPAVTPRQAPVAPAAAAIPAISPIPQAPARTAPSVPKLEDLGRNVRAVQDLQPLSDEFISSRSRDPLGFIVPALEEEAKSQAEAIMNQPFTIGGERAPVTSLIAQPPTSKRTPTLAQALMPQTILTPEQKAQSDAFKFAASQRALKLEQDRISGLLREAAIRKASPDSIRQLQSLYQNIENSAEYIKKKAEIESLLRSGGKLEDYIPSDKLIPVGESPKVIVSETAARATEAALTEAGPGGTIVETPLAYMGRLASVPASAAAGLGEAAITDKPASETVPVRIAEGRGAMGAGYDIGKASSDAAGLGEDDIARQAAQYIGGGAGLVVDFLIPIVPGFNTAKTALQAGVKASAASRALSLAPKMSVTKAVLRGAGRGFVEDVPVLSKLSPQLADDIYSSSIAKFGTDRTNQSIMKNILKVSGEMDAADAVKALDNGATQANTNSIEAAMRAANIPGSVDDFMASARRLGFDLEDKATHARIKGDLNTNVRKSLIDDGLSDPSKLRLAESNAQLSDKDLAELYIFLKNTGNGRGIISTAGLQKPTADAIAEIRTGLARAKIGNVKKAFEVIDDVGLDSLSKHYLYNQGTSLISDAFIKETKLVGGGAPDVIRLTRKTFAPKDKVQDIVDAVSENVLNKTIRPRLIEALNRGDDSVRITSDELDQILVQLGPDALKGRGVDPVTKLAIRDIADLLKRDASGDFILTPKKYNELVEILTDEIASTFPGSKTIFEVAQDISALPEGAGVSKKIYYNKVLTPKEVAGGTLESAISYSVKRALGEAEASATPISKEFVDAIGQKWGSINEDFKAIYRANRAAGLSAPDAWSKTMVENYISHSDVAIKEAQAAGDLDKVRAIKLQNYSQMFDDYVAMIYGGYESMIDAINTTGRTQFLDGMLVPPFEMRKLTYILTQSDNVKSLRDRFIQRALTGNFGEALVELRNVHAILQGKGIKSFIPTKEELEKLWKAAIASDVNGILGYLPFKTDGYQQGTRGAFEIWNYGGETAPMFAVDDHLKLLSSQYLVRKQSAIVSETYSDWSQIYPELFPTAQNINKRTEQYIDIIRSYPDSLYDEWAKEILSDDDIVKQIDKALKALIKREGAAGTNYDKNPFSSILLVINDPNLAALQPFLQKAARDDAEQLISLILRDAMDTIVANPDIAKKLYIAMVEDSLTSLSASQNMALAASRIIDKIKKEGFIDIIVSSASTRTDDIFDAVYAGTIFNPRNNFEDKIYKEILSQYRMGTPEATAKAAFADNANAIARQYQVATGPIFDYLFNSKNMKVHRQLSGVNDYISSIYPILRAETTPLFYDTLKTAVRQAAKSNVDIITKGPIEQVATIPLTFKETAAAKKSLLNKSGIEAFTEAMEELRISSTARKVEDMPNPSTLNEAIEIGLKITSDIRDANKAAKGYARFFNVIGDAIGSKESIFSDGRLARFIKGGVLGGQILPGLRYLGTNYLTAPALIYSTLGKKYASGALKQSVLLDFDVNQVMKIMMGTDLPAAISPASLADVKFSSNTGQAPRVILTTPTGKVYTNYDIAKIVGSNSIARSQASAELTTQIIDDLVSWSAINQKELLGSSLSSFGSIGKNQIGEAIKKSYGVPFMTGGRSINMFQELGQMTDTMFRTKVLIDALASGVSEEQAILLARESLFDYGNLTQVEKTYVNKIFWFWTFRRNAYRNVIKSFLTNPQKLKNAYLANGYIEEMDRQDTLASKDYTETRPFLYLINDKESKQRFGLYGPGIPQLQATTDLIDYLSYFPMIMSDNKKNTSEALMSIPKDIVLGYAAQATPLPQTVIGLTFGVDPRREGKELGYGIDPRLMWYLQRNPDVWNTFQALVNVEVVPPDSEIPGAGTYQGRQWRIRKGDQTSVRAWFAIQQLLLTGGVQRNMKDYAPLAETLFGKAGEDTTAIQLGGESENAALINIMYQTGVITPIATPSVQDQIEFNRRVIAEDFRQGTYKKPEN